MAVLVANDVKSEEHPYNPYLSEHVPAEFGTLKSQDGQTLHYKLLKPKRLLRSSRSATGL